MEGSTREDHGGCWVQGGRTRTGVRVKGGTRGKSVLFLMGLDLLQLIARGHCGFSTVKECCFALCKESAPVLQSSQVHNQEKLAILEGIELQHANQQFQTLQENLL
jgi:hypothetical protein